MCLSKAALQCSRCRTLQLTPRPASLDDRVKKPTVRRKFALRKKVMLEKALCRVEKTYAHHAWPSAREGKRLGWRGLNFYLSPHHLYGGAAC